MLLSELTGIKSYKGRSAASILSLLQRNHGIKITHGAYGVVLTHPSWDHVLKVFAKDDCYLKFVKFVEENNSKHLPVFLKKPTKLSVFFKNSVGQEITDWKDGEYEKLDKFYAAKIEKLQPLKMYSKEYDVTFVLSSLPFYHEYGRVIGTSRAKEFLENYRPSSSLFKIKKIKVPEDLSEYHELADLIFELREQATEKCLVDLHAGNFMLRGSTIVISDPYAGASDEAMELTKIFDGEELSSLTGDPEIARFVAKTLASNFGDKTVPLDRTEPLDPNATKPLRK